MFSNLKYILLAALLCLATAHSATIAVLEITIASDEEMNLTIEETKFLTDELRRQATVLLPKNYSVWTREEIISRVPQTAENLSTVIDIGRAIKSDYVTQGSIGKLGDLFTLTIELYSTSDGKLLGYFTKETPDLKGLLDVIRENSPSLFAQKGNGATIPTNIPTESKAKTSFWVAIGLDVLGATAIGLGIYNNSVTNYYHSKSENLLNNIPNPKQDPNGYSTRKKEFDEKYDKAQNAKTARNIFYATGSALLLGGVAVHIWF